MPHRRATPAGGTASITVRLRGVVAEAASGLAANRTCEQPGASQGYGTAGRQLGCLR